MSILAYRLRLFASRLFSSNDCLKKRRKWGLEKMRLDKDVSYVDLRHFQHETR